jgi:membrane-associated phospholipid phosphatase
MTTATAADRSTTARRITDVLEPKNWIIATIALLGWGADRLAGLGWAAFIAFFAAVLPTLFIRFGIRRWGWADRHVGVKHERMTSLAFITGSVALGVVLMVVLGAPHKMTGYIIGMLASAVVIAAITTVWKISVHCAVASAGVLIVALTFSHYILAAYALVALVAWSRVELRDHTPTQVIGGTALGAVVAVLTYLAVR